MFNRYLTILWLITTLLTTPLSPMPTASAAVREWDDGGSTKNWTDRFNWSNDTVPGTVDGAEIGFITTAKDDTVIFNPTADTVESLVLVGGADLDLDNGRLVVTGSTVVGLSGSGGTTSSELIVRPTTIIGQPIALDTGLLVVNSSGILDLRGGRVSVNGLGGADGYIQVLSGGSIRGYGTINLDDASISAPNSPLFVLEGSIYVGVLEEQGLMSEPPTRTLQINKPDALGWAQFNLDGVIHLPRNSTIDINQSPAANGTFSIREPTILMYANSRYERDFVTHLQTLNVLSGAVTVGETVLPAVPAVISGGTFAQNCSDDLCGIKVFTSDAELIFESTYNGFAGEVDNPGTIRFAGDANIGPGITFLPSGGTLVNENGSTLTLYDAVDVDTPLQNAGLLELGNDTIPNNDLGQVQVRNYTQLADGELNVDVGGIFASDFDAMTVPGNVVLDGVLRVELIDGFTPVLGNSFTIIETTVGNVGGAFDLESMPIFGDFTFDVLYNSKSVVLQVVAAGLAGDYNEDGAVDAADYTVWRDNLGSGTALPNDDTPGVGPDDYVRWKTHFGESSSGGGGALGANVPEPAAANLLLLSVLFSTNLRTRRAT